MPDVDCIFCQIVKGKIPSSKLVETEHVLAFENIHPSAKVHALVVPKKHITEFTKLNQEHYQIWDELHLVAKKVVIEGRIEDKGYRIVINGGGANEIAHLHLHVMGPVGRERGL